MADKRFLLGILAIALVLGMTVVGCSDGSTNNNNDGGIFTLNNIPAVYEGKYAYFQANLSSENYIYGFKSASSSTSTITLVKITNGQVKLPMWASISSRYTGNDTVNSDVYVGIFNTPTITSSSIIESIQAMISFSSITFSNGNATVSATTGTIVEDI